MQPRHRYCQLFLGVTLLGGSSLFGQSSGDPTVPVIVRFLTPPGQAERDAVTSNGGTVTTTYTLVNAAAVKITAAGKDKLKANGLVAAVEDDLPIRLHDAELDNTWGVKQINAGLVHDAGNTGVGVKVCVLDTGIDTTHSELSANYKGGYNFVNGTATPTDDNGHGTHTSGTIAAIMNAANVRGAAPQVDLYAYKILDASGNGYASSIIAALQECVKVGGKVRVNNRFILSMYYYPRHSILPGNHSYDQYLDAKGSPKYPQRQDISVLTHSNYRTSGGRIETGAITTKVMILEGMDDNLSWPVFNASYYERVLRTLGPVKAPQMVRFYLHDHGKHGQGAGQPGVFQQSVQDLMAWAEKGIAPPPSTSPPTSSHQPHHQPHHPMPRPPRHLSPPYTPDLQKNVSIL